MSRDLCEDTALRHHVYQSAQVSVIDINGIRTEDHSEFPDEAVTSCLDSKDLQDLNGMVARCPGCVDALDREDSGQIDAISLNEPAVFDIFYCTTLVIENDTRALGGARCVEYLRNIFETAKGNIMQNTIGDLAEEHDDSLAVLVSHIVWSDSNNVSSDRSLISIHELKVRLLWVVIECVRKTVHYVALELKVVIEDRMTGV